MTSPGVATNAAWMIAAELVGKASSFVLVVILARGFGPRDYGYFAFALAFLPLFLHLARWGIDVASLRRITVSRDEFSTVFVNGAVLRAVLAVAATVLGLVLVPLFARDAAAYGVVAVLGVALFFDELTTYLTVAFSAFERMRLNAVVLVVNRVVSTALAGVVVAAGGGLLAVCAAYAAGSVGATVVGVSIVLRRFPPIRVGDVRRDETRRLLREGAPFGLAAFLNMAVFRVDAVLLELLKGPVAVGVYGVAYRFFEPILFVTWSIAWAATPRLVRETTDGERTRTFELSLAVLLAFYLPIAVGAPFAADWLLERLFGAPYASAEGAVLWLAAAAVPYAVAHLARQGAIAAGESRSITAVAATALALNVAANLVLIPAYGPAGAAAATFATEVLECTLLLRLYVRRVERVRLTGATVAPVAAAACMAAVLWLGVEGGLALVVGPAVFLVALLAVGRLVAPGDLRLLAGALRGGSRP